VSPLNALRSVRSSLSEVAAGCDPPDIDVTLLTVAERAEPGFPSDPESAMALWPGRLSRLRRRFAGPGPHQPPTSQMRGKLLRSGGLTLKQHRVDQTDAI